VFEHSGQCSSAEQPYKHGHSSSIELAPGGYSVITHRSSLPTRKARQYWRPTTPIIGREFARFAAYRRTAIVLCPNLDHQAQVLPKILAGLLWRPPHFW
jgi:hypothetical protein